MEDICECFTLKKAFNDFEEQGLSNLAGATYLHEGCQRMGSSIKTVNPVKLMQLELQ